MVCLLLAAGGCASVSQGEDKYTIKNVLGPLARQAKQPRAPDGSLLPLEGQLEFDALRELYDEEKFADAESGFKKLAKKYKDKPIEEDALFSVAECQYRQQHYPAAQDSYDELLNKFTGSRFVETATKRLFTIANYWLNAPKPASDVELAAYEEGKLTKDLPSPDQQPPAATRVLPNFTDQSKPIFDTPGRALQALKSIWLKDPTGPLADDALMMAATHFLRQKDFREADHYFGILREQYPKSEHTQLAYVLGSHAKMMTYQGARFDSKQLDEARKLTKSTLKLFPQSPQRRQLERDLAVMKSQAAEREWEMVQLYQRKRHPKSAAVYCRSILENYGDTPFAEKAREVLAEIDPQVGRILQASAELPIQRQPQPVSAEDEPAAQPGDPSCAVPGRSANAKSRRTSVSENRGATENRIAPGRVSLGNRRARSTTSPEAEAAETSPAPPERTPLPEPRRLPPPAVPLEELPEEK